MENGKTGTNEVLALQGLDMWKAILEETDRRYMQKHILSAPAIMTKERFGCWAWWKFQHRGG
jgi:hypothetical protein